MLHQTSTPANRGHLCRAAFATLLGKGRADQNTDAEDHARRRWRGDDCTAAIIKANVSPSLVGDHPGLIAGSVADFLKNLPVSAASKLMTQSLIVRVTGDRVAVPYGDTSGSMDWVGEDAEIPVVEGVTGALVLSPRKMGVIVTASRELVRQADGERILRHMLTREAGLAFDRALFSADAGDATKVAGLLHGVTPIAGSEFGGNLAEVLAALASSLAAAGGSGDLFFAADPALAARITIAHPQLPWTVAPSRALASGTIVAIDPQQVGFASGDAIDILADHAATVHMDSTPSPIVDGGTADPVRSLYQTASIALRLILDLGFASRAGSVAYAQGVV